MRLVFVMAPRDPSWYRQACLRIVQPSTSAMFVVDQANADAIRCAWHEGGELAGVVELRRHVPLITDPTRARSCVHAIVGWAPLPAPDPDRD